MNYEKFLEYQRRAHSTVYTENEGGFHDKIISELAQKFLPQLATNISDLILDIGCGPGLLMQAARELGYQNLMGVTLSDLDYDACRLKGFATLRNSMTDLDLQDASVDVIWCRHALEHSVYPLFTLYEFDRVLKTNGRIFIEVPAPDNIRAFVHEYNPNHYSILGERMWDGLFEKAGFELLDDFVYRTEVEHDNKMVEERSYIFILAKSKESLVDKFMRKYNIDISN